MVISTHEAAVRSKTILMGKEASSTVVVVVNTKFLTAGGQVSVSLSQHLPFGFFSHSGEM